MGGVAGVEQQGPITRVEHRQGQVGRSLLGTHQQQHLRLRIHLHPKATLGPIGHCRAKGQGRCVKAVGGAGGLTKLGSDRLDGRLGGLQIGGAE